VTRWLAAVVIAMVLIAGDPATYQVEHLSAANGDPARGSELFAKLPCASCHDITKPWPGGDVCPNLGNIAAEAARIITLTSYRGTDSATVKLAPQSGSGESGTATLIKQGDKETKVVLSVTGGSGSQPVHIHKGTCAKLDPKPAFALSPLVNGKSETVVKASLDDLEKGGYAINGHKSAQEVKTYVFCGDIKKM
jgi:cytochrome c551/c552